MAKYRSGANGRSAFSAEKALDNHRFVRHTVCGRLSISLRQWAVTCLMCNNFMGSP
ncbi:hypothetical protein HMPREF1870_01922 [Bacteroidales bacterium KA00344]|nr:hypothetical protein HMPREF1870_01922 [Bacteroidales bacterium KA00344]